MTGAECRESNGGSDNDNRRASEDGKVESGKAVVMEEERPLLRASLEGVRRRAAARRFLGNAGGQVGMRIPLNAHAGTCLVDVLCTYGMAAGNYSVPPGRPRTCSGTKLLSHTC